MPLMMIPKCPGTCIVLTWRNANNVSIALGYAEYLEDVKQQETVKRFTQGLNLKRNL